MCVREWETEWVLVRKGESESWARKVGGWRGDKWRKGSYEDDDGEAKRRGGEKRREIEQRNDIEDRVFIEENKGMINERTNGESEPPRLVLLRDFDKMLWILYWLRINYKLL